MEYCASLTLQATKFFKFPQETKNTHNDKMCIYKRLTIPIRWSIQILHVQRGGVPLFICRGGTQKN